METLLSIKEISKMMAVGKTKAGRLLAGVEPAGKKGKATQYRKGDVDRVAAEYLAAEAARKIKKQPERPPEAATFVNQKVAMEQTQLGHIITLLELILIKLGGVAPTLEKLAYQPAAKPAPKKRAVSQRGDQPVYTATEVAEIEERILQFVTGKSYVVASDVYDAAFPGYTRNKHGWNLMNQALTNLGLAHVRDYLVDGVTKHTVWMDPRSREYSRVRPAQHIGPYQKRPLRTIFIRRATLSAAPAAAPAAAPVVSP